MVPLFAIKKKKQQKKNNKKNKKKNEQKNKKANEQTKTKNKAKPEKILSFVTDLKENNKSIPSASSKPYFILKNNQILVNTRLMIINFLLSHALRC